ncbi:transcriptional regulator PpsR [Roseivivax sediminis]|uniref:Transcriptional regulator PpsR n=1 Tax=Roseivivax sediminis TaxID=936889 RepID=A0A1I1UFT4_9RHOB|nr:transcriptional regulator PpsR [Roseivivax sediminis]SFD69706.1 transcriptional regulator PpsR [Roseivivax sediminis]
MTSSPRSRPEAVDAAVPPAYLAEVVGAACDVALVIAADGRVLSVVPGRTGLPDPGLADLVGHPLTGALTPESAARLDDARARIAAGEDLCRAVELDHRTSTGRVAPVGYSFVPHGFDGALLMLGRDLGAITECRTQLVQAQLALEQVYEARRDVATRYRVLLSGIAEPVVFVTAADGRIADLNDPAAALLAATRESLGRPLASAFATEAGDFSDRLARAAAGEGPLLLSTARDGRELRLSAEVFRAAGARHYLCRLEGAGDRTGAADGIAADLSALYARSTDAILFAGLDGTIVTCNDSFLDLIEATQISDVAGRCLSDYLGRGQVDLKVLVENARGLGQMRLYATRLVTRLGGETAVEMSVCHLDDRTAPSLAFVIRDASRAEGVRSSKPTGTPEDASSVIALVGSATLKEIVSETTDAVEKMCIETAVHLTRNNRVAAAEMLGLSRQSLYVKLRKFGLLDREGPGET